MTPHNTAIAEPAHRREYDVIGMGIDIDNLDGVVEKVIDWAQRHESRYVCVANVHMAVEANKDPTFAPVLAEADLVTTDGAPLVWMARALGAAGKKRVPGREQMLSICNAAEQSGLNIGLLGGRPETLAKLSEKLKEKFPRLNISYAESPPFKPATRDERQQRIDAINAADVRVLFVGLGCPKQERWMAEHRGEIQSVMLGVGAAFDFLAGDIPVAPNWVQTAGLEWLHRLLQEPKRLWRRYLETNSAFVVLATQQLLRGRTKT